MLHVDVHVCVCVCETWGDEDGGGGDAQLGVTAGLCCFDGLYGFNTHHLQPPPVQP